MVQLHISKHTTVHMFVYIGYIKINIQYLCRKQSKLTMGVFVFSVHYTVID